MFNISDCDFMVRFDALKSALINDVPENVPKNVPQNVSKNSIMVSIEKWKSRKIIRGSNY